MAIGFKNLRSPLLDLTDKITVGKLSGCCICDVIPDYYEYLIWAEKAGLFKYTKIVTETIQEHAGYKAQQRYQAEEVDPYTSDYDTRAMQEFDITDSDVPF